MVHDQTPVKTVNIIDMPWIELQCLFNNTVLPIPTDFSKYTSTSNHPIIATPQPLPHFDTTGCQILMSLDHQVCLATYVFRASLVGRFIQPVKVEHEDGIGIHDSWTEGPFWRFPKLSVLGTTVVFPSRRISLTKIGRDAVIIFEQLLIWCDIEMINTLYKENTHIQELYLPVMLCLQSCCVSRHENSVTQFRFLEVENSGFFCWPADFCGFINLRLWVSSRNLETYGVLLEKLIGFFPWDFSFSMSRDSFLGDFGIWFSSPNRQSDIASFQSGPASLVGWSCGRVVRI